MPKFQNDVAGVKAASESNLVPVGTYNVTIYTAKYGEYGENSANGGRPMLKLQYRISDGPQKGRAVFENLGLFPTWAPTQKNPDGYPNRNYVTFAKAMEIDLTQAEVDFPSEQALGGQPLKIRVTQSDNTLTGEKQNNVGAHTKADAKDLAADGGANVSSLMGGVEVGDSAPAENPLWKV